WYWLRSSSRRRAERMMVSSSTMRMCGIVFSRRSPIRRACGPWAVLGHYSGRYGRRFDIARQGNAESGSALAFRIGRAVDGDLSIMLFHDRIDQREPQTGALAGVLGGEEGLEQTVHDGLRDARAFVFDNQLDAVLRRLAVHADGAAGGRGVAGVGQ